MSVITCPASGYIVALEETSSKVALHKIMSVITCHASGYIVALEETSPKVALHKCLV